MKCTTSFLAFNLCQDSCSEMLRWRRWKVQSRQIAPDSNKCCKDPLTTTWAAGGWGVRPQPHEVSGHTGSRRAGATDCFVSVWECVLQCVLSSECRGCSGHLLSVRRRLGAQVSASGVVSNTLSCCVKTTSLLTVDLGRGSAAVLILAVTVHHGQPQETWQSPCQVSSLSPSPPALLSMQHLLVPSFSCASLSLGGKQPRMGNQADGRMGR